MNAPGPTMNHAPHSFGWDLFGAGSAASYTLFADVSAMPPAQWLMGLAVSAAIPVVLRYIEARVNRKSREDALKAALTEAEKRADAATTALLAVKPGLPPFEPRGYEQ